MHPLTSLYTQYSPLKSGLVTIESANSIINLSFELLVDLGVQYGGFNRVCVGLEANLSLDAIRPRFILGQRASNFLLRKAALVIGNDDIAGFSVPF